MYRVYTKNGNREIASYEEWPEDFYYVVFLDEKETEEENKIFKDSSFYPQKV